MSGKEIQIIAEEFILSRIYLVETKALNQQVKRNIGKFPVRYMFQLNKKEHDRLRSHFVTFKEQHTKYLPYAFTDHGILMLSFVCKGFQLRFKDPGEDKDFQCRLNNPKHM